MITRRKLLAAVAALTALAPLAGSGEPPTPVDGDFLEFLGNTDSDDPAWNEYMASPDSDDALNRATSGPKTQPAPESAPADKVKGNGADDGT